MLTAYLWFLRVMMGMLLLGILIFFITNPVMTLAVLYILSWLAFKNDLCDELSSTNDKINLAIYAPVRLIFLLVLFMIKPGGPIM